MCRRYPLITVLLLVAISLVATASHAARPAAVSEPLQGTIQNLDVGTPQDMNVVCKLGVTRTPAWFVDWLYPPDDAYYTLLDPADCAGCTGPNGLLLSNAHAMLKNFGPLESVVI